MMEFEPSIDPTRCSEALLITIDSSVSSDSHKSLRDAAFRVARTRMLYPVSKDDLVGVLQAGSETTDNPLAEQTPDGYLGIQLHVSLVTASIRAVRSLAHMTHDGCSTNLLNVLDVAGDRLVSAAAVRARHKRLLLFTEDKSIIAKLSPEDDAEFIGTCNLFREHEIKVDVIVFCQNDDNAHAIRQYGDLFEDSEQAEVTTPEVCMDKAASFPCSSLLALSKCTGGFMVPLEDALPLVDDPVPKGKRGTVKFNGVLDIAGLLKIPVKRYTFVSEVKPPSGKKFSWDETCKQGIAISVLSETNRVASAKDDSPLEPQQIVDAYPYGPDLVPAPYDMESKHPWHMHRDRGLDVIGFVPQSSVPQHVFLGQVDVVIPMKDSNESIRLLRALVLALHAEKLGILARSVMALRGGAPTLCYLWPCVELDRGTRKIINCYLFAVHLPMREDVRDIPFPSLEDELVDIPDGASDAMDQYITSCMLTPEDGEHQQASLNPDIDDDDDDDELLSLSPLKLPNPNLDWFNICIVHRVVQGVSSTDFPPLSKWHANVLNPTRFLRKHFFESREEAVQSMKTCLPILPAKQREKKSRRIHKVLNGDVASIVHYLPDEDIYPSEDDAASVDESESDNDLSNVAVPTWEQTQDDVISIMTDADVSDVGDKTPVEDFKQLVRIGKFRFAALSLQVVIRRIIRDLVDDSKALRCLQALRRACTENKEPRIFNDFVSSLVERCDRKDAVGNRTAAFFRYVGSRNEVATALDMIPIGRTEPGKNTKPGDDTNHLNFIKDISESIAKLTDQSKVNDVTLSDMCD